MTRSLLLLIVGMSLVPGAACASSVAFPDPYTRPQIAWVPGIVLSAADSNAILGNPSRLEKTTSYLNGETRTYQSAFRDDWVDSRNGKTGILYYMFEEYPNAEQARSFLELTLKQNNISPQDGIRAANGAELHYLKGGEVVRIVLIWKESRLLRLKVNQLTSRYSVKDFQNVAAKLAMRL